MLVAKPGCDALDADVASWLLNSNIDGVEVRHLLPNQLEQQFSDRWANAHQWLLRQVAYDETRHIVQTCRGVSPDNPWHTAYLVLFGDLPATPNRERNRANDLRDDLTFADIVSVAEVDAEPSVSDIIARMIDTQLISAIQLTRVRLPTSFIGGYNRGLPTTSRFTWGQSTELSQYGPNVLVVYRDDNIDDLALTWNLRARYAHPAGLPLSIPLCESTRTDIRFIAKTPQSQHYFGLGHNLAITSFSVDAEELRELSLGTGFDVVEPQKLMGEIHGCGVTSIEMAQFIDGKATVPCFTPTDIETLGQRYLGTSDATWLTAIAVVSEERLPPSHTMRRNRWQEPGYLHGKVVQVGKMDAFTTLGQPSGLEVLRALALDRSLEARVSTPGKAAENLIRAAAGDLSMFASPAVAALLERLARRGHASLVKRRLNQFFEGTDVIEGTQKYDIVMDRLDQALGAPDADEIGHLNINQIREIFGLGGKPLPLKATAVWVDWAVRQRLLLRGVQATCQNCKHVQWRPLSDVVPELECHGCGLVIDSPFGAQKIDYQYRASEILLRAVEHDVLPHVLALRYASHILRKPGVFGAYPGVEFLEAGEKEVIAEFDTVIILASGKCIVGECKARQRGLNQPELQKLWDGADRVGAVATFAATLEAGSSCAELWRQTEDPNGRPHFALSAGHLYDLAAFPALYDDDLFGWRDELVNLRPGATMSQQEFVREAFGNYLLRRTDDPNKRNRAHWDATDK